MKKVLHICSGNYYGGIEEVARLISSEQLKNKLSSEVVYFQKDFISKMKINNRLFTKVYYFFRFIRLVRLERYDILHNHSGGLLIDIFNLMFFPNTKLISHNHGCRLRIYELKLEPKFVSIIKQFTAKQIYKKILRISVSKFIYELQNKYERTSPQKNIRLDNPIDFDKLIDFTQNSNMGTQYNCGYLGRIVHYKGLKQLVDFAIYEKQNGLNYNILISGPGDFANEIEKSILENKLDQIVYFKNDYTSRRDFFKKIDIFISLSKFESFGLTLYEAIFFGKPIITLQKKSIDRKLHPFVWCLTDYTPQQLLCTIQNIYDNIDYIKEKHASEIKEFMKKKYSISNYIKSLEKIYLK